MTADTHTHDNARPEAVQRVTRATLLTLLAFEAGVLTLTQACAATGLTPRQLIDLESDMISDGRELAREMAG